jgi:hypothetical protein
MNNDKIIIVSFSINSVSHNVDVFCYLPSINVLGSYIGNKTISFVESELLPSPNWSNEDLKNAITTVTNVPTTSIFYYDELTDDEKNQITNIPGNNQFIIKTLV